MPVLGGRLPRLVTASRRLLLAQAKTTAASGASEGTAAAKHTTKVATAAPRRIIGVVDMGAIVCKALRGRCTASDNAACDTVQGLFLAAKQCIAARGAAAAAAADAVGAGAGSSALFRRPAFLPRQARRKLRHGRCLGRGHGILAQDRVHLLL